MAALMGVDGPDYPPGNGPNMKFNPPKTKTFLDRIIPRKFDSSGGAIPDPLDYELNGEWDVHDVFGSIDT